MKRFILILNKASEDLKIKKLDICMSTVINVCPLSCMVLNRYSLEMIEDESYFFFWLFLKCGWTVEVEVWVGRHRMEVVLHDFCKLGLDKSM